MFKYRILFFFCLFELNVSAQNIKAHSYFVEWTDSLNSKASVFVFSEDTLLSKISKKGTTKYQTKWGEEVRYKKGDTLFTLVKYGCCDSLFKSVVPEVYESEETFQANQKVAFNTRVRWYNYGGFTYVDSVFDNYGVMATQFKTERIYNQVSFAKNGQGSFNLYNVDTVVSGKINSDGDTTVFRIWHPRKHYTAYPLEDRWDNWYEEGENRIKLQYYKGRLDSTFSKAKQEFTNKTRDGMQVTSFFYEEETKYTKTEGGYTLTGYLKRISEDKETEWGKMSYIQSRFSLVHPDFAWTHFYYKDVCDSCYPELDSIVVLDKDSVRVAKLFLDYSENEEPQLRSKPKRWIDKNDRADYFRFWPFLQINRCGTVVERPNLMIAQTPAYLKVENKKDLKGLTLDGFKLSNQIRDLLPLQKGLYDRMNLVSGLIVFEPHDTLRYVPVFLLSPYMNTSKFFEVYKKSGGLKGVPQETLTIYENKGPYLQYTKKTKIFMAFLSSSY